MDKHQLRATAHPRIEKILLGGREIESRGYTSQEGLQVVNLDDFLKDEKIQYREKGKMYLDKVIESSEDEKGAIHENLQSYTFYKTELILTDKRVVFVEPSVKRSTTDALKMKPIVAVIFSIPLKQLGFTLLYRTNNTSAQKVFIADAHGSITESFADGEYIRSLAFHEYEKKRVEFVCSIKTVSVFKKVMGI